MTIDTNSVDCSNGDWGKDTFMDLVNIDETLKNIGTYWEVYCFIAEEDRTLDEIKRFLMTECYKPESTARAQVSAFKSARDNIYEFCEDGEHVCISVDKVNRLEEQMDDFLGFTKYDYRAVDHRDYEDAFNEAAEEWKKDREELTNRINKLNKAAWNCQMESYKKQIEYLKKLLEQPVLVTNDTFTDDSQKYYAKDFSFYSNRQEMEDRELNWIASKHRVEVSAEKDEWEEVTNLFKNKRVKLKDRILLFPLCMLARWKKRKYEKIANSIIYDDIVKRFAREMVEQKIFIIADFNGKKEPFKIVPQRYLDDLRKQVDDLEKQIETTCGPLDHKPENEPIGKGAV